MTIQRRTIDVPGGERTHSPIPEGARIGDLVFSSLLAPPVAGETGGDTVPAARSLFARFQRLLEAAGGGPENMVDLGVYVLDDEDRKSINVAWTEMFPDPDDRPSRHIINVEPKGVRGPFAANFLAVIPDPSLGVSGGGRVIYSPLINGRLPGGELPADPLQQAEAMWANVKRWADASGAGIDQIGNVMIYNMDDSTRNIVNVPWAKMFPDRANLPARQTLNVLPNGLQEGIFACIVTAVV